MPGLFALLVSLAGKFISSNIVRFLALKILLISLFVVLLPLVFRNFISWLFEVLFTLVMNFLPEAGPGGQETITIQLMNVGAYLAGEFQVSLCLSILISAVTTRFILSLIPGVRI
jgi:hypothetical protein